MDGLQAFHFANLRQTGLPQGKQPSSCEVSKFRCPNRSTRSAADNCRLRPQTVAP